MRDDRIAKIGRPGIGGEFLDVAPAEWGRYVIRRFRQVSHHRDEPRQFNLAALPASTTIYDLLGAIEAVIEHADENGVAYDLDFKGLAGGSPTLRERLARLAAHRRP